MRIKLIIILIIALVSTSTGCKKWAVRHKQRRDLRELEQKQREKEKEKQQKYQEAVKRHASIQDKKTRKAMKKQYRKAQRHNTNQKEFFIKRWFKGKKRYNKSKGTKN